MYQFVLADHYIRRNPHLAAPDSRVTVSVTPGASAVFPISRTLPRFNDPHTANHFTSACSAIVYRDELFGPAFSRSTFVSEPVHNLIHREVIAAKGITFTSRRAADEQKSEFLASSDNWFRPTSIQTGPDGALVGGRHVSRRHRASGVDSGGLAEATRSARRPGQRTHLSRLSGRRQAAAHPAAGSPRYGGAGRRSR